MLLRGHLVVWSRGLAVTLTRPHDEATMLRIGAMPPAPQTMKLGRVAGHSPLATRYFPISEEGAVTFTT